MKLRNVMASRNLTEVGSDRRVSITLGKPRRRAKGEWVCGVQITGLGSDRIHYVHGLDSVQSITIALDAIRLTLRQTRKRFTWIGGEEGDDGFPVTIPTLFGPEFSRQLEQIVDREVLRFSRNAKRRTERRLGTKFKLSKTPRPPGFNLE